ncbi:glycoside hydrolase family 3 C-terminal domain-containing protein [Parafrigoribacterium humi]|uniref:glycoside hydrolase family 3 C-terminal domain-containing protein n=1 Tax=Parafrigoribacterium humi TaxID=3144664 RepID=UPI0032EBFED3
MAEPYGGADALGTAEKAALLTGSSFWNTAAAPGIRSLTVTDGPHGVRKPRGGGDQLGLGTSMPATCFPPAVALASTFNAELVEQVGEALGVEAHAQNVSVLLGPGVNIKRSPLCGRNFEYFSEDPLVSGELGAALVRGLQRRGVGASLKHFAVNNQETGRMTVNAEVDERALREIYLPAFETIVTREQPWTVMCSYNRLNGVAAAESHWLLTKVLREEWGFRGVVVSDWGAVDERVPALAAGLDLEMPGPQTDSVRAVESAIENGELDRSVLDTAVDRLRELAARARPAADFDDGDDDDFDVPGRFDVEEHHTLARQAAGESIVLLRNDGGVLPLRGDERVAVIGELARTPRIQGAGSSQVNPTRVDNPLEELTTRASAEFAPGYMLDGSAQPSLRDEAVALAAQSDVVLLFLGLPAGEESEGFDRTRLDLPDDQLALVAAVAEANSRVVVVLSNGGVVTLEPWHDSVAGILECWLLGQGSGSAIADVVFGDTNPSGRLAESIPFRLQDTPSYLNFPGEGDVVHYGEGIFVGYRYYETVALPVRYPFGFGLSYTSFGYEGLSAKRIGAGATVSVTVTNTGTRAGSEVVQLYVAAPDDGPKNPARELRAFTKVSLAAGESRVVTLSLGERAFSFWDVASAAWVVHGGEYRVQLATSAHDVVDQVTVRRAGTRPPHPLTLESSVAQWLANPVTGPVLRRTAARDALDEGGASVLEMVASMPMRRLLRMPGVDVNASQLRMLARVANNPVVRGVALGVGRLRSTIGRSSD